MNRNEIQLKALSFEGENWLLIADFPDYYVSDSGRVASMKCGRCKVLMGVAGSDGYKVVNLCKNGRAHTKKIHKVEMTAFKGYSNLDIDHKNGDKTNNMLSNLEYVTRRENSNRYYENSGGTSKHRGVSWNKERKKWRANIYYTKLYHLGCYEIEADAAAAYNHAISIIEKGLPEAETIKLLKQIKKNFKPDTNQAQLWSQ